ncbi:ATP-dependent DNA helicase [Chondrinema litorale]|uniref:ATP-dependent DNA helicase n=1 Tax=Chondrinema litorale TaxID=2994555 RepID=UPI002542CDB5|nr:ATP-dependent RecD-like DNA helicase [Chondrinema litorale]UZR99849.1 ATP-dependent RecD-like DNA helicase [Chondrinema litorale]
MKINYNPRYIKKHLSIRVPWHDNAWNGTVCTNAKNNDACLVLKNCAENRNDNLEKEFAGRKICEIKDENKLPPCISESAMFMADFDFNRTVKHPYAKGYNDYYKHLLPSTVLYPKYSAPAVPFRWGMPEFAEKFAEQYNLEFDPKQEPYAKTSDESLKFTTNWVQHYPNQKAVFDCFFEHLNPNESLSFFYAKEVPFVEENNRVLIGLGEILSINPPQPFDTSNDTGFVSMPWEHMVNHSIRPDFKNGFIFPYHQAIEYQKTHPNFDPKSIAVIIPNEFRAEFSYATEHVSHDFAIYILRESIKKIELAKKLEIGSNWDNILDWLSKKLFLTKKLRGDYPGFGSSLAALGIKRAHFLAQYIFKNIEKEDCPWEYLENVFIDINSLPEDLKNSISPENIELWHYYKNSNESRLFLLQLLSRFNLSESQVKIIFDINKRKKEYQDKTDQELIKNPYLLYEISIHSCDPINYSVIDTGLMLNTTKKLKPFQTKQFSNLSKERIKALTVMQLEFQANNGHTLFPEEELVKNIANLPIEPECNLNSDYFNLAASVFDKSIVTHFTADNKKAYQLSRFNDTAELINSIITKRINAKKHNLQEDWGKYLSEIEFKNTDEDLKAKEEKTKALEVMANARFSVLIGQAGSGKTTLLSALASIPQIKQGNVLFLAPTGKARVRMEEKAKKFGVTAKTIASFLFKSGRFKGSTQSFHLNDAEKEMGYKTVIIDECSMLTEEMLAATLQHLKRVERLILVGDYRQLPPIGAGRPFVDIINFIKPEGIESRFPKIDNSYIELTTSARQVKKDNKKRLDTDFANLFGGNTQENNADEIFEQVIKGESENIKIYSWDNESNFDDVLYKVLESELDVKDEKSFNKSIGANDAGFFNWNEAVKKIEDWQLLSPVKSKVFGTNQLNRGIHQKLKKDALDWSYRGSKTPKPLGLEKIIYGDKVINMQNHSRSKGTYPDTGINYIANGEIGISVGRTNWKNGSKPYQLEVEFSSQVGYKYQFTSKDFDDEKGSYLELAYALTIHKAQGSQFNTVILVIPEPCVLLSRELLYTALSRQVNKVILLYQGNPQMLFNYINDSRSANLQRITNLFYKPNITRYEEVLFEKNLIHCASDGKFLRSKSEVIIYELLLKNGLEPEYEFKLEIDGQTKRPDFYIIDDDMGIDYYWEHLGMLNDSEYYKNWEEKLAWYKSKNILPFDKGGGENGTLIITKDDANGGVSAKEIAKIIEEVFEVDSKESTINDIKELTNVVFQLRNTVESYFSELSNQFKEIKQSSIKTDERIESIYKVLDDNSKTTNLQAFYSKVESNISNYELLEDNSKMFLASAYFIKEKFDRNNMDDYSPFVLQFSRAIENELLRKFFVSFYPKLDILTSNDPLFLKNEFENSKSGVFAKSLKKRSEKFTLGTMAFIFGYIINPNGNTISSSNLLQEFRGHIVSIASDQFLSNELKTQLNSLTNDYRNKAAHISQISKQEATDFLKLGTDILESILKYLR